MLSQRNISRRECEISQAVNMAQMHMFDLAYRRHGYSRKIIHLETDIPLSTIKSYEEGTTMPIDAVVKVAAIKGFPNELVSLLFMPADKMIGDSDPEETDIDDAALAAIDLLQRYVKARHADSPGGIRIVHNEVEEIRHSAAGFQDRTGKVAAA